MSMTALTPTHLTSWVGRVGAALAVMSAFAHLAGLAGHGLAQTAALTAMALGCLYCAWHLWTGPEARDWALVATMNIGMLAVHQNMSMPGSHAGHHGSASAGGATMNAAVTMPSVPMGTMSMGTVSMGTVAMAIGAAEAAFATVVLFVSTRRRVAAPPPVCG
nr:hypothetical protein [Rhodococcus sp. (in: high G+C Gram-positive bacteria)]